MQRQLNARSPDAGHQPSAKDLKEDLSLLYDTNVDGLRAMWKERLNSEPPNNRSAHLLRRLLAWQLQARMNGGLNRLTTRRLSDIALALERDGTYEPKTKRDLSPGVILTREWKGVVHTVTVLAGGFHYLGKRYRSLSDIARTITGTRWSGPRFFRVEQKNTLKQRAATQ